MRLKTTINAAKYLEEELGRIATNLEAFKTLGKAAESSVSASVPLNTLADNRADTIAAYLRVLEETQPRALLLENVYGLAYRGKDEGLARECFSSVPDTCGGPVSSERRKPLSIIQIVQPRPLP